MMTITIAQMEHVLSLFPWPPRLRRPRGIQVQLHGEFAVTCHLSSHTIGMPAAWKINSSARAHTPERAFAGAVESYIEKGPELAEKPFKLSTLERANLRAALRMLTN